MDVALHAPARRTRPDGAQGGQGFLRWILLNLLLLGAGLALVHPPSVRAAAGDLIPNTAFIDYSSPTLASVTTTPSNAADTVVATALAWPWSPLSGDTIGRAGETVIFLAILRNGSNTADTATLTASAATFTVATFADTPPLTPLPAAILPSGGTTPVYIVIRIPSGAAAGSSETVYVAARSMLDPSIVETIPIRVTVDTAVVPGSETTAPTILQAPVVSPSTVSNTGSTAVTFTVGAADASGIASVTLNLAGFSANYSAITPLGDTGSGGDTTAGDSIFAAIVTIDSTVLGGTYNLVFTVTDNAGNTASTTVVFTVTDPSPPVAPLLSPDPLEETPDGIFTIWGDVVTLFSTYADTYDAVHFEYRDAPSGTWIRIATDTSAIRWSTTWNVTGLSPDTYDARAVGVVGGNTDASPGFVRLVVRNSADSIIHEYTDPVTGLHILRRRLAADTAVTAMIWDGTELIVPRDAVTVDTLYARITVHAAPPFGVPASLRSIGVFRRFVREDGASFFDKDVTVVLPYNDDDNDGKEDSTGIREEDLALYFFNTQFGAWQRIPNSVVNRETNTVQANVQHFTDFAIFGTAPAGNLSNVIVVPNPFVPNDGSADNGVPWTAGDDASGVQFRNVTDVVTIEIYNIAGRKVATINASGTRGNVRWNVQSDDNRDVASGVYIAILRSSAGEVVTRRFVIVR